LSPALQDSNPKRGYLIVQQAILLGLAKKTAFTDGGPMSLAVRMREGRVLCQYGWESLKKLPISDKNGL
jgi:hypothetical protein